MTDKYILEGHKPRPATLMEWATWYETADRIVKQETVGDARVSTVFLGLNHQWGDGPPLLFETMVFREGRDGDEMERYSTWEEAEAGHASMVERIRAADSASLEHTK